MTLSQQSQKMLTLLSRVKKHTPSPSLSPHPTLIWAWRYNWPPYPPLNTSGTYSRSLPRSARLTALVCFHTRTTSSERQVGRYAGNPRWESSSRTT